MSNTGKLYVLLIGINEYDSRRLRRLECAVADVLEFGDLLTRRAGLAVDRCLKFISSGAVDEIPTRARLLEALERFAQMELGPEDTFILYFSGHGFSLEGETFLMAKDSTPGTRQLLTDTALSLAALKRYLRRVGAGQIWLILDACRNEPDPQVKGASNVVCDAAMTKDIQSLVHLRDQGAGRLRRAVAILSACWEGHVSYEDTARKHSWFCRHLLETLNQFPLSALEVTFQWVTELGKTMKDNAPLHLPAAARQEPHLLAEGQPVRLSLAPRPGSWAASAPDPSKVVVMEAQIAPLHVQVTTQAMEAITGRGLPPIPGAILELEGKVRGLAEAIEQLEAGTHPALAPAHEAVQKMKDQRDALVADLERESPELPESMLNELRKAAAQPLAGLHEICAKYPDYPQGALLRALQGLRALERAESALRNARLDSQQITQLEIDRLQKESRRELSTLLGLWTDDLETVLRLFFDSHPDASEFPLAAWNEFEPHLHHRGYRISAREILQKAEKQYKLGRDHAAWNTASGKRSSEAVREYRDNWPNGAHVLEAEALEKELLVMEAWEAFAATPTTEGFRNFLKTYPKADHAAFRQQLNVLQAEDWRKVSSAPTLPGVRNFLSRWQEGTYVSDAEFYMLKLAKWETTAWKYASRNPTPIKWQIFLERFPEGHHAPEARNQLGPESNSLSTSQTLPKAPSLEAALNALRNASALRDRLRTITQCQVKKLLVLIIWTITGLVAGTLIGTVIGWFQTLHDSQVRSFTLQGRYFGLACGLVLGLLWGRIRALWR